MMQIGESFVGEGVNAAHINTVYGHREGPVGVAWATALATPSQGHVPYVAVVQPSIPAKPMTLFVTKAAPASDNHGTMIWGPAQAGVAAGVMDAVAAGALKESDLDSSCIIAAVWVNPGADDADAVFENNREATKQALINGAKSLPNLADTMLAAANPRNPYFSPKDSK
jgi:5,6,7,8-tetrahydromethanopterin hydro-lyase